jgi:hypothetical protein
MVYVMPLVGVVAGLGAYTAYDWWWAALLATTGVIAGAGYRFGWFGPLLMAPYAATFVTPVSTAASALTFGAIVAIGVGYGIVIARRFGAPPVVEGARYSLPVTVVLALVFGAVLGAAASVGVALSWTEPYWVCEPILILVLYLLMGRRERIREKAFGTAAGAAAAVVVAIIAPPSWVLTALAIWRCCSRSCSGRRTGGCTAYTRFLSCSTSLPQATWRSKPRNAGSKFSRALPC